MRNPKLIGSAAGALAILAGCGEPTADDLRRYARTACLIASLDILAAQHPELNEADDELSPDAIDGDATRKEKLAALSEKLLLEDSSFKTLGNARFVFEPGRVDLGPPAPAYDLKCTGDLDSRKITTVQIEGTIHRPKAEDENWSF
jgi:hypothetical protein